MQYIRATIAGSTYFFTLTLKNRSSNLLITHIDKLRFAFKKTQLNHPFKIDAVVILPEHLHLMMTLPIGDCDYSKRLMLIKGTFSRQIESKETISLSRKKKRERGIWQRRFWEHVVRDDLDYEQHVNYIHYNPVKHRHALNPVDWPYSSIHRYIKSGLVPVDWGADDVGLKGEFGE